MLQKRHNLTKIIQPYEVLNAKTANFELGRLKRSLETYADGMILEMNPDFQRGHVWTREQQIDFIEAAFKNPDINLTIAFNEDYGFDENVEESLRNKVICIDGLQRCTAIFDFIEGKFNIFDNQVSYQDIKEAKYSEPMLVVKFYKFNTQE